ncbi:MAG: uracil-DNA glycosylase [Betaproteobacteria bacterium]|nr:uracil-DNA glycosylase [Betaproteobacteria bacterium]
MGSKADQFDLSCRDCPRLCNFLDSVRERQPGYHALPVPSFGDAKARLLVVGLAPGMHGANRTGRPFTGDYAGILLFRTLHKFGYGSHAGSDDPADGLKLRGCRITNAVKCLPPENKPETSEIKQCNRYLSAEIAGAPPRAILALGGIAHGAVLRAFNLKPSAYRFAHRAVHSLGRSPIAPLGIRLFDSYHCSRYNTQTKRLTDIMFEAVFQDIGRYLAETT